MRYTRTDTLALPQCFRRVILQMHTTPTKPPDTSDEYQIFISQFPEPVRVLYTAAQFNGMEVLLPG